MFVKFTDRNKCSYFDNESLKIWREKIRDKHLYSVHQHFSQGKPVYLHLGYYHPLAGGHVALKISHTILTLSKQRAHVLSESENPVNIFLEWQITVDMNKMQRTCTPSVIETAVRVVFLYHSLFTINHLSNIISDS